MKLITKYILSNFGGKVIDRKELEEICNKFEVNSVYITN